MSWKQSKRQKKNKEPRWQADERLERDREREKRRGLTRKIWRKRAGL